MMRCSELRPGAVGEESSIATAVAQVTALAWIQSLAWELACAMCVTIKKQKEGEDEMPIEATQMNLKMITLSEVSWTE